MTISLLSTPPPMNRRQMLLGSVGLAGLTLSGCATVPTGRVDTVADIPPNVREMYGPLPNEPFPIPAARLDLLDPNYYRQVVSYATSERPGTIVVDTPNRYLYLVRENGEALRYGVGIGREGFAWQGRAVIRYKRKWPTWTPPAEMIARQPELEPYRHGMPPGLENPLGPRALYIFKDGRDTLYRLHGNMDARSIGQAVSSGCVRLLFQDVIDLYDRVPDGTPIVVLQ